jgi:hypothetical protein
MWHSWPSQARCRRKLAPRQDVSAEQKVFMFNWNVHLRKHPVHADWQARSALPVLQLRACCKMWASAIEFICMHSN